MPHRLTTIPWKQELNAAAYKYHMIVVWVAVVLNPLWAIGDYFNVPAHFTDFLIWRITVSLATLIGYLFRHKLTEKPHILAFIPFMGIAIQNAYMYNVMDISEIQKHTFAYIALFIGAGMLVLWQIQYSIWIVAVSFIANIICFNLYSPVSIDELLTNGGLLTLSVALFTILLINTRTNLTKKEIIARLALAKSNEQLAEKNEIIEEKNKDIKASITYAQRIQHAILPPSERIENVLKDYFIYYTPKDIVSGDFYWFTSLKTTPTAEKPQENIFVIAAVDCTGHGVPGALMSIIGSTILNQSTSERSVNSPADALSYLNKELAKNLNSIKDGMDMSLCAINFQKMTMEYAGANNPVYVIRNKQLIELKPDKIAIGADHENYESKKFSNQTIQLEKGDTIYLFTDGYADQFGGPLGKKLKYKQFQNYLLEIQDLDMPQQQQMLNKKHLEWKGALEQVDDILVIGIKI
ncbi:MAG: SpoIIE family protein phosphatase [Bacteroidetes bacterium]|nr:SpoIIE family protein phosphatase [Bacteroidota bacterium]